MKLSTTVLLCFTSYLLSAQFDHIDLNKYITPDLTLQRLDLGFDFSTNVRENSRTFEEDAKSKSFSMNPDLTYFRFNNSRSRQSTKRISLGSNIFAGEAETSEVQKNKNYNFDARYSSTDKFYNAKNGFFELAPAFSYRYRFTKSELDDVLQLRDEDQDLKIGLGLFKGHGRLEAIHDMRSAIFILEGLASEGRLEFSPDSSEIMELAQLIGHINNERFFDFRHKLKYQIQELDKFIAEKAWVSEQDAIYFTTLLDEYRYSNRPIRYSGTVIKYGVRPEFLYSFYKNEDDNPTESDRKKYSLVGSLSLTKEKAISHSWQRRISGGLDLIYSKLDTDITSSFDTFDSDRTHKMIRPYINLSFGYYPTSRTSVNMSWRNSYTHAWETLATAPDDLDRNQWNFSSDLQVDARYYISPRFRLNGSLSITIAEQESMGFGSTETVNSDQETFGLRGGLTYSIF